MDALPSVARNLRVALLGLFLTSTGLCPAIPHPKITDVPWKQVLTARQLFPYFSYKDVQIFHYSVPQQVEVASWEFRSNCTSHCLTLQVSVYLQHGSYPVVNLDKNPSSPHIVPPRQPVYFATLTPDLSPVSLNVTSPFAGDWFAVSFYRTTNHLLNKEDLSPHCQVWLSSTATFHSDALVTTLLVGNPQTQLITQTQYYRFFSSTRSWSTRLLVKKCAAVPSATEDRCPLMMTARPRALPPSNSSHQEVTKANCSSLYTPLGCSVEFLAVENDWNYIRIDIATSSAVEFEITVESADCEGSFESLALSENLNSEGSESRFGKLLKFKNSQNMAALQLHPGSWDKVRESRFILDSEDCIPEIPLVRQKLPGNFAFQYISPGNSEFSQLLNISTVEPNLARFFVMPIVDIGGTLSVEVALPPSENKSMANISVNACLSYNRKPHMDYEGNCIIGYGLQLNSTALNSNHAKLFVPYPEAGAWYLMLKTSCYFQEEEETESEVVNIPCLKNVTSVVLKLESGPCVRGQCGMYGRCYQYLSGGLVFSSCLCSAGWKGWECSDGSEAHSYAHLLMSVLLLTLSNILFLPAIILAVYRRFFTEALVYVAAMVFSALYHACDFEVSPFCMMRLSVLQYCDVYAMVMALWLTLVALADLPTSLHSILHMTGALGIALGVEYERAGLWVVVIPVGVGLLLIAVSWMCHCCHQHSCYPKKRIWLQLMFGLIFLAIGLVLFVWLENHQNYVYLHSSQHVCLAMTIFCLLPDRRAPKDIDEDVMQVNWKPHGSFKFLQDNETDML